MSAERRPARAAALVLAGGALLGCAVQAYDGPRRPSKEVAVIESDGTVLTALDERSVDGSNLAILPGVHALAVKLDDSRMTRGWRLYSDRSLVACFLARPGHTYEARPVYAGREWRIEMIDETLAEAIRVWPRRAGSCDAEAAGNHDE